MTLLYESLRKYTGYVAMSAACAMRGHYATGAEYQRLAVAAMRTILTVALNRGPTDDEVFAAMGVTPETKKPKLWTPGNPLIN